jgi:hypothetical protein
MKRTQLLLGGQKCVNCFFLEKAKNLYRKKEKNHHFAEKKTEIFQNQRVVRR